MKKYLKKGLKELGGVLLATVVVGTGCFFMVHDTIVKATQTQYSVHSYNVEKEELLSFRVVDTGDKQKVFNPKEKELEKELEVEIVRNGKKENIHFSKLSIVADDVQRMQLRMNDDEDKDDARAILVVPNKDVLYE